MNIEIRDERFRTVVGDDIALERLATGFIFTEGAGLASPRKAPDLQRHAGDTCAAGPRPAA
jgi:hypothetical protein